jgi:hypothetical protein
MPSQVALLDEGLKVRVQRPFRPGFRLLVDITTTVEYRGLFDG